MNRVIQRALTILQIWEVGAYKIEWMIQKKITDGQFTSRRSLFEQQGPPETKEEIERSSSIKEVLWFHSGSRSFYNNGPQGPIFSAITLVFVFFWVAVTVDYAVDTTVASWPRSSSWARWLGIHSTESWDFKCFNLQTCEMNDSHSKTCQLFVFSFAVSPKSWIRRNLKSSTAALAQRSSNSSSPWISSM